MKKTCLFLLMFSFGIALNTFSQTAASTDSYAGKWEITVLGTPRGDVKFVTNLIRKDGKLTGELSNAADTTDAKRTITSVEESTAGIIINFESSQGSDVAIELNKVDNDNLKGSLMSFDATAKRIKN